MVEPKNYIKIFLNPGGFIEQDYVGKQMPEEIIEALKKLVSYSKKLRKQDKPVLILVDLSRIGKIDLSQRTLGARQAGLNAMRSVVYQRAAVCGPLPIQILVKTLAIVAGVHGKIRVFDNRVDAVRWLRAK